MVQTTLHNNLKNTIGMFVFNTPETFKVKEIKPGMNQHGSNYPKFKLSITLINIACSDVN